MDFSGVRLVVADMDGTLLNANHELPADLPAVLEQLSRKSILFSAASGRQYFNILKKFSSFHDKILFIAENGSYVLHEGKELLVQAMDKDITRQQLTEARGLPDVFPILCGKKQAYVDNDTPGFIEKLSLYYDRFSIVDDLLQVEDDQFLKIALCDLAGAETNSYIHFRTKDNLQVKVSGQIWLDLSHPLANKGRALRFVQETMGITREQTMAFGDYLNDIEMMEEAAFSYAMENAHPEVKKISKYATASNDQNGVLEILYQVICE